MNTSRKIFNILLLLELDIKLWMKLDLLEQLYADFPEDAGCFTIYLFNHIKLKPGEAIYIEPNMPHAYLSGGVLIFPNSIF